MFDFPQTDGTDGRDQIAVEGGRGIIRTVADADYVRDQRPIISEQFPKSFDICVRVVGHFSDFDQHSGCCPQGVNALDGTFKIRGIQHILVWLSGSLARVLEARFDSRRVR